MALTRSVELARHSRGSSCGPETRRAKGGGGSDLIPLCARTGLKRGLSSALGAVFLAIIAPSSALAQQSGSTPPKGVFGRGDGIRSYRHGVPWEAAYHVNQATAAGGFIFVAGQFSHDAAGRFIGENDVGRQTRQTLSNLSDVLAAFGCSKSDIVELEVFLIHPRQNQKKFTEEYRHFIGDASLTVTLIGVTELAFPQELIEVRAVARAQPPAPHS